MRQRKALFNIVMITLLIFHFKPSLSIVTGGMGYNLDRDSDIMRLNEEMSAWEKVGRMKQNDYVSKHAVDIITMDLSNICP